MCIEVDRHDIAILLQRKPMAGMDMLAVLGRQFHASQKLVRVRAAGSAMIAGCVITLLSVLMRECVACAACFACRRCMACLACARCTDCVGCVGCYNCSGLRNAVGVRNVHAEKGRA